MHFKLKNTRATYRSLVNKMFANLIGKIIEVYVDDLLVKGLKTKDNLKHLDKTFQILRRCWLRLNVVQKVLGLYSQPKGHKG